MTLVLVVSDDHWGARAQAIAADFAGVVVAVDRSGGLWRAMRLVLRGSIPLAAAWRIWRAQRSLPSEYPDTAVSFADNAGLRAVIAARGASEVILFRAGLIISGKTLQHCRVRNIHCADTRAFGGLASIHRALDAGALNQTATLHIVTDQIDEGEVLDTESYLLDASASYPVNEKAAYEAGLRLLARTLAADQGAPG